MHRYDNNKLPHKKHNSPLFHENLHSSIFFTTYEHMKWISPWPTQSQHSQMVAVYRRRVTCITYNTVYCIVVDWLTNHVTWRTWMDQTIIHKTKGGKVMTAVHTLRTAPDKLNLISVQFLTSACGAVYGIVKLRTRSWRRKMADELSLRVWEIERSKNQQGILKAAVKTTSLAKL